MNNQGELYDHEEAHRLASEDTEHVDSDQESDFINIENPRNQGG